MTLDLNEIAGSLKELREKLESFGSTPVPVTKGPEDQGTPDTGKNYLSRADMFEVREQLQKKSTAELSVMFDMQLSDGAAKGVGIPYGVWARTGGGNIDVAMAQNPDIRKALDSSSGSALIRQDLEPVLYELFVRTFPAFDRFTKEPANGLIHAFNQWTAFGDAQFLSELGTVTDDQSTYVRQSTNVGILATRRGVSLKEQFAAVQSGGGFNPENLELQGGLRAMAHKMQLTIFQGQSTDSGGTGSNETGPYDANGFTGLRSILNTANAQNVDPTAGTPEDIRKAIDTASLSIVNNGATASILYVRPNEKLAFDTQQDKNVRYIESLANVTPGVNTIAVNTLFGAIPMVSVPGDSIGHYTRSAIDVADMYLLDERTISLPYLGSPGPTVLDIPMGISGQLTHLYIIFGMWGLAVKFVGASNKIRVKQP